MASAGLIRRCNVVDVVVVMVVHEPIGDGFAGGNSELGGVPSGVLSGGAPVAVILGIVRGAAMPSPSIRPPARVQGIGSRLRVEFFWVPWAGAGRHLLPSLDGLPPARAPASTGAAG